MSFLYIQVPEGSYQNVEAHHMNYLIVIWDNQGDRGRLHATEEDFNVTVD